MSVKTARPQRPGPVPPTRILSNRRIRDIGKFRDPRLRVENVRVFYTVCDVTTAQAMRAERVKIMAGILRRHRYVRD